MPTDVSSCQHIAPQTPQDSLRPSLVSPWHSDATESSCGHSSPVLRILGDRPPGSPAPARQPEACALREAVRAEGQEEVDTGDTFFPKTNVKPIYTRLQMQRENCSQRGPCRLLTAAVVRVEPRSVHPRDSELSPAGGLWCNAGASTVWKARPKATGDSPEPVCARGGTCRIWGGGSCARLQTRVDTPFLGSSR